MIKIVEVWGADYLSILKELETQNDVTHIVFDFLNEIYYVSNTPEYDKIFDIAHKKNIPITILTPYPKDLPPLLNFDNEKYKNVNIIHWESFWFNRTYEAWKPHERLNIPKGLDIVNPLTNKRPNIKFPYITLNNIAKHHRCLVMDLLAKHNLIESGAIAWRDINHACNDIRHTFPEDVTDSVYMGYQYKYWKPKRMILDQGINDRFLQETLPTEFTQSFMQLVTESDDSVIFHSEKTVTPILLNKPFLIASAKGHHNKLKDMGFQLYDEVFDYSFDTEMDINVRYEGLIENVKRISLLSETELNTLHSSIFEKLAYNKQHALKLIRNIPEEIQDVLSLLKQENQGIPLGSLNMFL